MHHLNKISPKFSQILSLLLLLALMAGASGSTASAYAAAAAPANGGTINGTAATPDGAPLPEGTLVKLFDAGLETVHGQAVPDPVDGSFQFGAVRNGMYVLKAVPPEASGYTQSLPRTVSVMNLPVDAGELLLTHPQVFGTVLAPDGLTPAAAEVFVNLPDGRPFQRLEAPAGQFAIGGLPAGDYRLHAAPLDDLPYWRSEPLDIIVAAPPATQTLNLALRDADLWGYTHDDQGNPLPGALVAASNSAGERQEDHANVNGYWAIGSLAAGDYQLGALPPWQDSGLLPPIPVTVTLPGASSPYDLIFLSPPKLVHGFVRTQAGEGVSHAQIVARRTNHPGQAETFSAADGSYEFNLGPGLWALTVRPVTDTLPADWVFPSSPKLVAFRYDNAPEERSQDFTVLVADSQVNGIVQMPDGSPPPFTVTVGLFNDEGVGLDLQTVLADGSFSANLPSGGYKVAIHPHDPGYVGPSVDPITLPADGSYDLGVLTLLARDAIVTGTLSADGVGLPGIPLVAWRSGAPASLRTTSGPDGAYALAVSAGIWHIQPAPGPEQPYLYTGPGQDVEIEAGGVIADVNFDLLAADATISGVLVDEAGSLVSDVHGWATAALVGHPNVHNGAPIEGGLFTIQAPAGDYNVAARLPAGAPYTSAGERQVSVASGEDVHVVLTVRHEDARIVGALWDPRNMDIVEGVQGQVAAWSEGNWAAAPIDASNGSYRLDVAGGLWHLNYHIDPDANYARINGPYNVPVESGATVRQQLPVLLKDALVSGVVLDPQGQPLGGVKVLAKGASDLVRDTWLETRSAPDGTFELALPFGRYHLAAAGGDPAWIKPGERIINVLPGSTSSGHTLQFRLPDATVSGTLTISNTTQAGPVHVWAWSDDGGFVRGVFSTTLSGGQASGAYQLAVTSGTVWHLRAVFETPSQFWAGLAQADLGGGSAVQDILLEGPHAKPAPVVVTFDAADPQNIDLADGTHIYIPGGAMPVSGLVTLRIVPLAALPSQQHANLLDYGYSFLATGPDGAPIEAHFNQDVVISFSYSEAELQRKHIHEQWLKPVYFSTTTDQWAFPESFAVDMQADRVVMQIDHFTDYALSGAVGYSVYLPLTAR